MIASGNFRYRSEQNENSHCYFFRHHRTMRNGISLHVIPGEIICWEICGVLKSQKSCDVTETIHFKVNGEES